jgi:hypothetical protein
MSLSKKVQYANTYQERSAHLENDQNEKLEYRAPLNPFPTAMRHFVISCSSNEARDLEKGRFKAFLSGFQDIG